MAVSANHNLGGHVILLRLYLIDIVRKIIGGFQDYGPFHKTSTGMNTEFFMRVFKTWFWEFTGWKK